MCGIRYPIWDQCGHRGDVKPIWCDKKKGIGCPNEYKAEDIGTKGWCQKCTEHLRKNQERSQAEREAQLREMIRAVAQEDSLGHLKKHVKGSKDVI
ncbi:hypothetical protein HYALB_00007521 [Hymenoscyphus albidus]|uniref:Uncharacterized protein n=1 Tax=Hymenoscyphus albidus TaxID=595503 RepID=A0A9N9LWH7_9HELO|nr:hypothetical protein HYALB_00007521 [Hymenoscyphus albidus]